jgi:hypothetical protein
MTEPVAPKRKVWRAPHACSVRTETLLLGQLRKRAFSGDVAAAESLIRLGREKRQAEDKAKKAKARMEKARAHAQQNRDAKKMAAQQEAAATE